MNAKKLPNIEDWLLQDGDQRASNRRDDLVKKKRVRRAFPTPSGAASNGNPRSPAPRMISPF